MTTLGTLTWSNREPAISISGIAELDAALDRLAAHVDRSRPIIATLTAHDAEALIGIGADLSFVQLSSACGAGPCVVTSAPATGAGVVESWLHGAHHTETRSHHLVSPPLARAALREFMVSGAQVPGVAWA